MLLDEQKLAFNLALHATEEARAGDSKTVVIVTGGPGSGKSVIALSLLGELARRGRTVVHATGSRSFTQTLRKVAGRGSRRTQSPFKYFNSFTDAERNGLEVLILDEAHRIRETSANRYTPARLRNGRRQVGELLAAAPHPTPIGAQRHDPRYSPAGRLALVASNTMAGTGSWRSSQSTPPGAGRQPVLPGPGQPVGLRVDGHHVPRPDQPADSQRLHHQVGADIARPGDRGSDLLQAIPPASRTPQ